MSKHVPHNRLLLLAVLFICGNVSNATQQEPDTITFNANGTATELPNDSATPPTAPYVIVEYPFKPFFLEKFPRSPFDFEHTGNRKRYTAVWNVSENKLFLAKFAAKIDGETVGISSILPDKELPLFAFWYTGELHVLVGGSVDSSDARHPYYGRVLPKVRVLSVKNGVIIGDVEKEHYRIANPANASTKK